MFLNEMTKRFPCWTCVKQNDPERQDGYGNPLECFILREFLESMPTGFRKPAEESISCLTFDCDCYDKKPNVVCETCKKFKGEDEPCHPDWMRMTKDSFCNEHVFKEDKKD